VNHAAASSEFLLWSEVVFLWAVASYGVSSDPLPEDKTEKSNFAWKRWRLLLAVRCVVGAGIAAVMSHSTSISFAMLFGIALLPLLRIRLPLKLTSGTECCFAAGFVGFLFWNIESFHLQLRSGLIELPLTRNQVSAFCILGAVFFFVVRGGTYIVRGFLKIADVLPRVALGQIDTKEVSRGRLIGNIERLILTIVIAAGSYAALGFLIAAKGLIRANEFDNDKGNREFTEYFLVGSLASVLIALCAGLIIRFVLVALWPELLSLQMQSS
jgi:uncharacterized membrane protein